jgi:hypothetical protein
MNTETELLDLFEAWRSLAMEEGNAISRGDWVTVAQCQNEKRLMQDRLAQAEIRAREANGDEAAAAFSGRVREVVQELAVREKEILSAAAARRREAAAKAVERNGSSQDLKRIDGACSFSSLRRRHAFS